MKNKGQIFQKTLFLLMNNISWILVVVAVIIFSLASERFLTTRTLMGIIPRVAALGMLVIGQSMVMLTGNMDLSSESVLGLAAFSAALILASPEMGGWAFVLPSGVVVFIMLSGGAAIGAFNGFMITKMKLNSLVFTITMLMTLRGIPYLLSNSTSAAVTDEWFNWLGGGNLFTVIMDGRPVGFQVSILITVLAFSIVYIVTKYTQFGRNIYAVGASKEAAESAGINSSRIIFFVYIISGICSALAAWLLVGRMGSATMKTGVGWIFVIQAASIVGGISLKGGRGNMVGALGGVVLWGVLDTGLFIIMASPWTIDAIRGAILLLAVLLDAIRERYIHHKAFEEFLGRSEIGLKDTSYLQRRKPNRGIIV